MKTLSRKAGFAIALAGVLAAGPDAAYLRAQHEAGGSTSVISVWRYSILAICNLLLGAAFEGGPRAMLAGVRQSFWPLMGASGIIILINIGMCISLLKVEPAFALLLMSLSPLWAAAMGKLLLGDALPTRTLVAQGMALLSTLIVFVPALRKMIAPKHPTTGLLRHDLLDPLELVPLATGFAVAALLTYSRWQADASLEAAPALGAALTAVAAGVVLFGVEQAPLSALVDGLAPSFWLALLLAAGGCAMYDCALVIAPRALTSAEVALVLLAETLLGPLSVWLAFGTAPAVWTLAGGGLLLATLIGHELAGIRAGDDETSKLFASSPRLSPRSARLSPPLGLSPRLSGSPRLGRMSRNSSAKMLEERLHTPLTVDAVERIPTGTPYSPPPHVERAIDRV